MKYKVMINGQPYKVLLGESTDDLVIKEDKDIIKFSVSGDILSYKISKISSRTQYLLNNGTLGLCLIVQENPNWINWRWRSEFAASKHSRDRCIYSIQINNLQGSFDLNNAWWLYNYHGCLSQRLYRKFYTSAYYRDPYVETGYENIKLGIGRYYATKYESGHGPQGMRPYKVTKYKQIIVTNKEN